MLVMETLLDAFSYQQVKWLKAFGDFFYPSLSTQREDWLWKSYDLRKSDAISFEAHSVCL